MHIFRKRPSSSFAKVQRDSLNYDSPDKGFEPDFSNYAHQWAQYAPFFSVEGEDGGLSNEVPQDCQINFVQLISRHGARYPTTSKGKKLQALIDKIQKGATLSGDAAFLKDYKYELGTESLVSFGQQELVNSGIRFVQRYPELSSGNEPFIRSTNSQRVMESANEFIKGFQQARGQPTTGSSVPTIGTVVANKAGTPNTLNHATCDKFEQTYRDYAKAAKKAYLPIMMPSIRTRLKDMIQNVDLADNEILELMEMCSFETVAANADASTMSPFCDLFTESEWSEFEYVQSLVKWSAFGHGNPLGPTQGIGYLNELYARLTDTPVKNIASIDQNLVNAKNFPLGRAIYLDFTHDNGMIPIFSALGLYDVELDKTKMQSPADSGGFSSSWVVPFAARAYIERMECCEDSYIRLIVNERVVPLKGCDVDDLGRCSEEDFLENTLAWARADGNWQQCYTK
ncbi:uncharacterized protein N7459_003001 [Penicillium hispanicum]|uniref:uncharacterized protein n=1 Tax=Penicillium hispanicum TaxID=1080232 RepID=UPI0025400D33|nr:uncharacterized protein N7459_003001 [Penicillium hispanicum]KAJ5587236.1 hypothetical protein N7459_003001 [Penicillium hispanicum]